MLFRFSGFKLPVLLFLIIVLSACNPTPAPTAPVLPVVASATTLDVQVNSTIVPTPSLTATLQPPRLLTVCMGSEPRSLFPLSDNSVAARTLRQALFDGPVDNLSYEVTPVILASLPSIANASARLELVSVQAGERVVDASGNLAVLSTGTPFLPAGCRSADCAQAYSGSGTIQMEQLVLEFRLRPGLLWSDGAPLLADDSLFTYELARALYPSIRASLLDRTSSYTVQDEQTLVWRGIPGERSPGYAAYFFSPLPRHVYGATPAQELLTQDAPARQPVGWGPYQVDEWTPGDHITLSRNPNYFRAAEGLPHFDYLVFRFYDRGADALQALLVGECDYVDETAGLADMDLKELRQLQDAGRLRLYLQAGTAWEHLLFNLAPQGSVEAPIFAQRSVRQALAQCIDRPGLIQALGLPEQPLLTSYTPPDHPAYDPQTPMYAYDPQAAAVLLEAAGWLDLDGDAATPRQARGVPGITDGSPLSFTYLVSDDPYAQTAARWISASLAGCGVQAQVEVSPAATLFAPGPEGPVFGRRFSAAQFAWTASQQPACFIYTTSQIPGPYPEFANGWGGANAGAYSNPEFDQACAAAQLSLPDEPAYHVAHSQAQAIFAEDLPALPLFLRLRVVAGRPDLCGVQVDVSAESALWNLEQLDYGGDCQP